MAGIESGFTRLVTDLVWGAVNSSIIATTAPLMGSLGAIISGSYTIASIIAFFELTDKMDHWSLFYTLGYLVALLFMGRLLMEPAEFALNLVFAVIYATVKASRKL